MSKHCEDCGTKMYNDTCPNCMEELYIYENQDMDISSEEFLLKVKEQEKKRTKLKKEKQ